MAIWRSQAGGGLETRHRGATLGVSHAVRHSLFSNIFIPAKVETFSIPGKMFVVRTFVPCWQCIQTRHVAGALELDCVFQQSFEIEIVVRRTA